MARYVALLRAINVGGHVVKMERLRALFEALQLTNVETFIASGNVLFDAAARDASALERRIERHLEAELGYEVATFLRTPAELGALAALDPFGTVRETPPRKVYVTFLREPPPTAYVARIESFHSDEDELKVIGREMWWACRTSIVDSPFGKAKPDKTVVGTARSITTVRKLAAKAAPK